MPECRPHRRSFNWTIASIEWRSWPIVPILVAVAGTAAWLLMLCAVSLERSAVRLFDWAGCPDRLRRIGSVNHFTVACLALGL